MASLDVVPYDFFGKDKLVIYFFTQILNKGKKNSSNL